NDGGWMSIGNEQLPSGFSQTPPSCSGVYPITSANPSGMSSVLDAVEGVGEADALLTRWPKPLRTRTAETVATTRTTKGRGWMPMAGNVWIGTGRHTRRKRGPGPGSQVPLQPNEWHGGPSSAPPMGFGSPVRGVGEVDG